MVVGASSARAKARTARKKKSAKPRSVVTSAPWARTSGESAARRIAARGGATAEAPARRHEDRDEKARGEGDDRQPPEEQQPVGIVPAVQEAPPELPLPGGRPGPGVGLQYGSNREERRRGEELHERRLLGVQAVVAEGEVGVARGQVRALVERGRVAAQGVDREPRLQGHRGGHESERAAAHLAGAPSATGRGTTSSTARAIARAAMRCAISFGCSSSAPSTTSSLQSRPR